MISFKTQFRFKSAVWWIILSSLAGHGWLEAGAAETNTVQVTGLRERVEIFRDRWGIAHIYAQSDEDLFFAQGFNVARDRLFQLEVWRRQATGTAAEIIGRRGLDRDVGARLHRFRGNLSEELNHYHPRGATIILAFVRGINVYIEQTERDHGLLPIEFKLLGINPGQWTPEVVISRHQGLFGNVQRELSLGRAVARLGPDKVKDLSNFQPGEPELALDRAIDSAGLFERDILKLYSAFRTPLQFQREDLVPEFRKAQADGARSALGEAGPEASLHRQTALDGLSDSADIGSNNWVVNGDLTLSRYPMLANDPHRVLQAPSLRYFAHLVAPGWNVIGGGEPTLPGVSIGHNEYGAWGLTIFQVDTEDLYVYETNPANPSQYRYKAQWLEMETQRDSIRVKGEPPVEVTFKYTRHGPVLHEDPERHVAYALRAAWREIGCAPYLASLRINQAKDWNGFHDACRYHRAPSVNMVWADRAGNIGWQVVAIAPVRRKWSGLVPVPGDGRFEWDGFLPVQDLPHVKNPAKGFWATANENLVPRYYPHRDAVGWTWAEPYRGARIQEVLASSRKFGVMDMIQLQQDELSLPARTLVPLLRNLAITEVEASRARELLLAWNFVLDKDSVPAAIYVSWERRLLANVRALFVPEKAREWLGALSMSRTIDWLLSPDGRFGDNPTGGRDALLAKSLIEAVTGLRSHLGPDMAQWRYGQEKFKHALIEHPMSAAVDQTIRKKLDVGPLPRGGNGYTPNSTGDADNQTSGASFRVVADTANWDNAVGTNTPGQSGNPDDPHYRDLFEMWATGKYFPLAYSRQKVESVTESRTVLQPRR